MTPRAWINEIDKSGKVGNWTKNYFHAVSGDIVEEGAFTSEDGVFEHYATVAEGMSGGPIFIEGKLLGIHQGYDYETGTSLGLRLSFAEKDVKGRPAARTAGYHDRTLEAGMKRRDSDDVKLKNAVETLPAGTTLYRATDAAEEREDPGDWWVDSSHITYADDWIESHLDNDGFVMQAEATRPLHVLNVGNIDSIGDWLESGTTSTEGALLVEILQDLDGRYALKDDHANLIIDGKQIDALNLGEGGEVPIAAEMIYFLPNEDTRLKYVRDDTPNH